MLTIRRLTGVLVSLVALVASGTAQAKKVTHKYSSTLQTTSLATANGYPLPGGTATLVGPLKTKPLGSGALIDRIEITGQPAPNVFAFTGKETDFLPAGTMRNTFSGTSTVQPDGSQVVEATGRFTGGTARYRGLSGRYTFDGTVAPGSTLLVGHSHGRIAY